MSVMFVVKAVAAIARSPVLFTYRSNPALQHRVPLDRDAWKL